MDSHHTMLDWALNRARPLVRVVVNSDGTMTGIHKPLPTDLDYPVPHVVKCNATDRRYAYFAGQGEITYDMPEPNKYLV